MALQCSFLLPVWPPGVPCLPEKAGLPRAGFLREEQRMAMGKGVTLAWAPPHFWYHLFVSHLVFPALHAAVSCPCTDGKPSLGEVSGSSPLHSGGFLHEPDVSSRVGQAAPASRGGLGWSAAQMSARSPSYGERIPFSVSKGTVPPCVQGKVSVWCQSVFNTCPGGPVGLSDKERGWFFGSTSHGGCNIG